MITALRFSGLTELNGYRVMAIDACRKLEHREKHLAGFCKYNAGNSSGNKRIFRIYQTGIQTYKSCPQEKHNNWSVDSVYVNTTPADVSEE